jgi:O-acetyl-ADP-ribose deacetylase (regulator of RNase III)
MVMSPCAEVTAVEGDLLLQLDCDAIVNSANEYLIAGGGVCGAIYRAAGPELEPYTRRLAPLALGEAVISPGFKLSARWIAHTRGPKYYEDPDPPRHLAQALTSAIRLADQNRVTRLPGVDSAFAPIRPFSVDLAVRASCNFTLPSVDESDPNSSSLT